MEAKEQAEREPEATELAEPFALTPEEADVFARVARDRR